MHVSSRPATIHFSTKQYVSRYSCHDTIPDMIRYITTKQEGYWYGMVYFYNKHDIEIEHGSTHAFLVSAILNITLNTAQRGFKFSSVCSENEDSAFHVC